MKTLPGILSLLVGAMSMLIPPDALATTPPSQRTAPAVERSTASLATLDRDLDQLHRDIEGSRFLARSLTPRISERLGRARPRVREAVSSLFGLRWDQVESTLATAHQIERKIADLERLVEDWKPFDGSPAPGPAKPGLAVSGTGAITGFVVDEATGLPLANVSVWLDPYGDSSSTDSTGRYALTGLTTGTYYVYTSNDLGYINEVYDNIPCQGSYCSVYYGTPIAVTDGAVTQGVDFSLAKYGGITGTVTDLASGQPVSQLYVEVYKSTGPLVESGRTDSTGGYAFTQLPAGSYFVSTSDSRYLDQLYDAIPCEETCEFTAGTPVVVNGGLTTANIDFALQLAGSVSGKVTASATGAPITSGYVMLYDGSGAPVGEAYLSSSGSYRVTGLDAGTYFAKTNVYGSYADILYNGILCEPSCSVTTGTPVPVTLGQETANIDFALPAFGAFRGRAYDSVTGFPLASTSVSTYSSSGAFLSYDYADTVGSYYSDGLTTGNYFAVAKSTTHLDELYNNVACLASCNPTTGTPIAVTFGSTTGGIDFALDLGGGVLGNVTAAATGAPLPYLQVELFGSTGTSAGYVNTNSQGSYIFQDLLPGTYFARSRRDSSSIYLGQLYNNLPCEPSCTVTSGTPLQVVKGVAISGVNFALQTFGSISGTVTESGTGLPLSNLYVNFHDAAGTYLGFTTTNASGSFRKTGLLAGTYYATTAASGYVPQLFNGIQCVTPCTITAGTPIPVSLSSETAGVNFALTVLGRVTGKVTDAATGLPLPYVNVGAYDTAGTAAAWGHTDETGMYSIQGLLPGNYFLATQNSDGYVDELHQNLDGGAPCDVTAGTPVSVAVGQVSAGIDFRLHKPYFADVDLGHWARRFIEGVYTAGVTAGCDTNPARFCPDDSVTRWQMAAFLARAIAGSDAAIPQSGWVPGAGAYSCYSGGTSLFPLDVPPADSGCRHIHYIYSQGITAGCGANAFCPDSKTTRWQMAVFMARAIAGSDAGVPASGTIAAAGDYNCVSGGTSLFPNDVPPGDDGCRHIHYIYSKGVTSGCGPGSFCPTSTLPRDEMATFLSRGFNLTKYGP